MKTTVEIGDDLFRKTQKLAREQKTTFRELTEQGLRYVLRTRSRARRTLPPLTVVRGKGLSPEFKDASWEKFREAIYGQ